MSKKNRNHNSIVESSPTLSLKNIIDILKKHQKYLFIFLLIGTVIYFPILFNGFVWDDNTFIINNPEVKQFNLSRLLGSNMFNSGPFYRPIPAIYFAFLYSIFGNQAFFYHLIQLILHLLCTTLLFFFFHFFFAVNISFFLALIFLVHPFNVESVAYIGSTQSQLYFIPGIIALLLSRIHSLPRLYFLSIVALLFIAIMTKETGYLFILLVIFYQYLFKLNQVKQFIISSVLTIVIYALLRVFVGGVTYKMGDYIPIATLSLFERILNIPAIIFYYIKTFIFPLDLAIWQIWVIRNLTIQNFILPLILSGFFFISLLLLLYFNYKKALMNQIIFFLLWFTLGLGLLLQLVPLDMTVADRWFYFPIVGLLGLIGVVLEVIKDSIKHHNKTFITTAILIICLLSFRTFIRTFDWKDNIILYGHDVNVGLENPDLLRSLANALFFIERYQEGLTYAKRSVDLKPSFPNLLTLGLMYQKNKQFDNAVSTFDQAINVSESFHDTNLKPPPGMVTHKEFLLEQTYVSLATTYLEMKRPSDAIKFINEEGLKKFPTDPRLYYFKALAEYSIGDNQNALEAITKSQKIWPNKMTKNIRYRILNNLPIDLYSPVENN